jgi:hypothetical protein
MARARGVLALVCSAAIVLPSAAALGARTYADPHGDASPGPDIRTVAVSTQRAEVTFHIRFTARSPLRIGRSDGWVDMLLVGIDVPPLGRPPIPGGEWRGANFAAGLHGPAKTGLLVRLDKGSSGVVVARLAVVTRGATVTFSLPRRALGNPPWFAFQVAAAREWSDERAAPSGATPDVAPSRGTFRYGLTS